MFSNSFKVLLASLRIWTKLISVHIKSQCCSKGYKMESMECWLHQSILFKCWNTKRSSPFNALEGEKSASKEESLIKCTSHGFCINTTFYGLLKEIFYEQYRVVQKGTSCCGLHSVTGLPSSWPLLQVDMKSSPNVLAFPLRTMQETT